MADAGQTGGTNHQPPRLRVALFNDTSGQRHHGCTAVMDSIERLFGAAGIGIGWRHQVRVNAADDPGTAGAIAGHDAVVVNGEGTLHSSRNKARGLASLGPMARAAGKRAWLINATLQDNDDAIVADLAAFDHIWVRESASAAWARAQGLPVTVLPDLSLCQPLDAPDGPTGGSGTMVIDSVLPAANLTLYRMARAAGGLLWTMEHDASGRRQVLHPHPASDSGLPRRLWVKGRVFLREPVGSTCNLAGFAAFLLQHQAMVTGRFHAVCLALMLRLPFHALPSNTWKIQATLADAGLNPARMLAPEAGLPAALPFSPDELAAITRYIAGARTGAQAMAERILTGY